MDAWIDPGSVLLVSLGNLTGCFDHNKNPRNNVIGRMGKWVGQLMSHDSGLVTS